METLQPAPLSRGRRLLFTLTALILGLLMLEAVASTGYFLLVPQNRRESVETALGLRTAEFNSVLRYRAHPYFNYIGNADFRSQQGNQLHGAIGLRPTDVDLRNKPPGTFRIVALGGSTTYGMYIEQSEQVWPSLVGMGLSKTLQREIEVINAGMPNYTTFEMLGMATMWLPEFSPDMVLIHTGLNDAFTVAYPDEGGPDNTTFRKSWNYRPLPQTAQAAMRTSRLFRLLGMGWIARGGHQVGGMTQAMQNNLPPEDRIRANIDTASGKYFRRNLDTLLTLTRHAGAEPVLVTIPLNPNYENGKGLYYDAVSQAVVRNNRIMAELAAERDVMLIDLYPAMRDPDVYSDAAHVKVPGMMQKAQMVFEAILPQVREMTE
jgi:hypothetical protein